MPTRRRSFRPAAPRQQRVPTRYSLWEDEVELNALAASGDIMGEMIDRSVLDAGPIRIYKCTTQFWMQGMDDVRAMLMAVIRQTSGGAVPDIRSEQVVTDLRNENKLLRGPWVRVTCPDAAGVSPNSWIFTKSVVLKNLTLDSNDDVEVVFTNLDANAFAASSQKIQWLSRIFWRQI